MIFGLTVTLVVFARGFAGDWSEQDQLVLVGPRPAAAGLGPFGVGCVGVGAVREVFEAQTLANVVRFPIMFLGGVFVPVDALPIGLQIVARLLPLTYAVEVICIALTGTPFNSRLPDLVVLAGFTAVLFALAVRILGHHMD